MIGQDRLINLFKGMIEDKTVMFPKFVILVGLKGSGRKMLANKIYDMIHGFADINVNKYMLEDTRVDSIRAMISHAQRIIEPTIYIIPDADKMSTSAKNSMLKITEEPPANAWFILTLENENNTLSTIRSRGQIYKLDMYSPEVIHEYAKNKYGITNTEETEIIIDICETPGEVDFMVQTGIINLYDYVQLVVDNIAECNGSNAFKIADKIAFKDEEDKFDLRLFWKTFMKVCTDRMKSEHIIKYADGVKITSQYMQQLNVTGINRSSTFDLWVLSIRESWL